MRGPRTPTQPRQGWKDVPLDARSGRRLDRGFAHPFLPPFRGPFVRSAGQAQHRTHNCPLTAVTLATGGGESCTPPSQPTEIRKTAFGAPIRRASGTPGPGSGRVPEPGAPRATRVPHVPSHRAGGGPLPPGAAGLDTGPAAPPSGRAAERLTARRGRRSVLFGRVGPPHAAGEAPAPRTRLGRLRPAAPRAAAGSWPRASGRAPAGMLPGRRRAPRVWARAEEGGAAGLAGQLYAAAPPLPARPSGRCCPSAPSPPRIPSLGGGAAPPSGRAGSGGEAGRGPPPPEEPGRSGLPLWRSLALPAVPMRGPGLAAARGRPPGEDPAAGLPAPFTPSAVPVRRLAKCTYRKLTWGRELGEGNKQADLRELLHSRDFKKQQLFRQK